MSDSHFLIHQRGVMIRKGGMFVLQIERIWIDCDAKQPTIVENAPMFSWCVVHDTDGAYQRAYRVQVRCAAGIVWDTGLVESTRQQLEYAGEPLVTGETYTVSVMVKDCFGETSAESSAQFFYAGQRKWTASWIRTKENEPGVMYFYRKLCLHELPVKACLYVSGIGCQQLHINGSDVDDGAYLNPAFSGYHKQCYYTVHDVTDLLIVGQNGLFFEVGHGWRDLPGYFLAERDEKRNNHIFGPASLIAELELCYADGRRELIGTDESWLSGYGAVVQDSLFDGEVYDASCAIPGWNTLQFSGEGLTPSIVVTEKLGALRPQTLQNITEQNRHYAHVLRRMSDGSYIFDFGINIAGVCCLHLPSNMPAGSVITMEYAEELLPDGSLDKETLRKAKATDQYRSGGCNLRSWTPRFTYHGFRYVRLSGYPGFVNEQTLAAIEFCNDIRNASFFSCGNTLATQIQQNILRTELNNLHHLATDCPQRDERMGWMNDATVRFEGTPYNFYVGRLFPKIMADIAVEQRENGALTDTAPYLWGRDIADPVCSAFLVAAQQMLQHYGDLRPIRQYYDAFKRWNQCLSGLRNEEGIIAYSVWGDWAGPADYCDSYFDGCHSTVTPGALMSTGYHYYNTKLLASFALLLGDQSEHEARMQEARDIQRAFLKKWFHPDTGFVCNGSQGAQAFALWLGILPEEQQRHAARRMFEAVKEVGYRLTTGNLTTKYLLDMLAKFGYADAAWKLVTRETYPSWGYMIQNGATTVWERFEKKRGSSMNSHDHPMYGAIGYWFYAWLLGLTPLEPGWTSFAVRPVFPTDLCYAEAKVDTLMGCIYAKWQREEDEIVLLVDVPFGAEAVVSLPSGDVRVASGSHCFVIASE